MLGDLPNELSRIIAFYKNRTKFFVDGRTSLPFSLKEVVRHHLFSKAEALGLVPVPNLRFMEWTYDLICLRGMRPEYVFILRESNENFKHLYLLPNSVKKVIVAMNKFVVPDETLGLDVVIIPKQPTGAFQIITARQVIMDYATAFQKKYGFGHGFSTPQLIGMASKIANFWAASAADLNFLKYCHWFIENKTVNNERVIGLHELFDRNSISSFRRSIGSTKKDQEWIGDGWSGLD